MRLTSIGSDFEMGLLQGLRPVSVEGRIGGTKERPMWVDMELGNVQEDNVLAEGAIVPCYSMGEFVRKMSALRGYLFNWAQDQQLKVATECTLEYDRDQLMTPQAMEFGCDVDYNSWTGAANPRPRPRGGRRSAGGHVHIGVEADASALFAVGRAMDAFATIPLMLVQDRVARRLEVERRTLYGQAGAVRLKEYGLEYRTLSNYWTFDDKLIEFVYDAASRAVQFVADGHADLLDEEQIVPVVNQGRRPDLNYFYQLPGWEEV